MTTAATCQIYGHLLAFLVCDHFLESPPLFSRTAFVSVINVVFLKI